jgi:hypothetical protein
VSNLLRPIRRSSLNDFSVIVGFAAANSLPIRAYEIVGSALDPSAQVTKQILTVDVLLAPLSNEEIKIVRCLGLNYSDHAVRAPGLIIHATSVLTECVL